MHQRHWFGLLLAGFLSLTGATPARAQEHDPRSQSHILIPLRGMTGARVGEWIRNRAESAREREEIKKLVQDVVANPEKYHLTKQDIEKVKKTGLIGNGDRLPNLDDPETQALLRKIRDQHFRPGQLPDPGSMPVDPKVLEKFVDPESSKLNPGLSPPATDPSPQSDPGPRPDPRGPPPGMEHPPPGPSGPGMAPPAPPALYEPTEQDQWQDRLRKLLESDLKDSAALREVSSEFRRLVLEKGGAAGMQQDGFVSKLPRVSEYLPLQDLIKGGVSSNGMPALPSWNRSRWSGGRLPAVGVPSFGSSESPNEGVWMAALYLVMGVIAAVVVWKFLASYRAGAAQSDAPAWRLGPWPVSPAAIATRHDLVLAFEYLALLLFGPAARSWNHRAIAAKISQQSAVGSPKSEAPRPTADCRLPAALAAARLAALYEQARYAPPDEPLPERELDDARRDLYLLAGVTGA
jgi:hypothetical protein